MDLYTPDEDTFFLLETLVKQPEFKCNKNFAGKVKGHKSVQTSLIIAEIGCGNSLISNTLGFTISTDINDHALEFSNSAIKIKSHLLSNLKNVDVVVFNPPYLETETQFYEDPIDENFKDIEKNDCYKNDDHINDNKPAKRGALDKNIRDDIRYSGGLKLICEFIDMLTAPIVYLLVIRKNNPDLLKRRFCNKGYAVFYIAEKKIMGETLIIIKGVKKDH